MMMKKNKPILYDPLIIPRVKQYLEENVHQTYVDVSVMARQLQERYREYTRRKSGPFRLLVEQAYKTVLHSYGLDSNPSTDDEDANSELEMMEDRTVSNHMNNMLTNLYSKTQKSNPNCGSGGNSATNEAIDISSDESGDEGNLPNGKSNKLIAMKNPSKNIMKLPLGITATPTGDKNRIGNPSLSPTAQLSQPGSALKHKNNDKNLQNYPPPPSLQPQGTHGNSNVSTLHINKKRKILDGHKSGGEWKKVAQANIYNGNSCPSGSGSGNGTNFNPGKLPSMSASLNIRPRKFKKEVTPEHPQQSFQNLGGMERVLKELCELLFHYRNPQIYHHIGLSAPRGLLLHGPPGCGKTMLAEAIAGTLEVPFINVPATELIAGVSGESEERIREIFEQATLFAPCVLFIDEIDAISSNRINAQKDMERRIVAQLISSLDGLQNMDNGDLVLVVGATNRPEVLDPALRRVGRFDHEISIGIPDRKARDEILRVICEKLLLENTFDFDKIAELTPGYVGADLFALAFRAASIAVKRKYFNQMRIRQAEDDMYIPIVDLLDEAVNEPESGTKSTEAETDVPMENKDTDAVINTEVDTNKLDDETKKNLPEASEVVVNEKSDDDTEKSDAQKSSPKPSTSAVTEMESTESNDKPEKMETDENPINDIPSAEQSSDVSEPKNAAADTTPPIIDVENISATSPMSPMSPPPQPPIVVKTKKEPSLLELLHWLNSDSLAIQEADLHDLCLTMSDFQEAVKVVQPSAKREGFITVPDVTWNDIGSLSTIREELQLAVLAPVKFPDKLNALGLSAPSGILLCGPPGCGKTLLAKAVANEAGINFISVKGPELMNMYVGESERAVRTCFQRARNSAPCVIFFDEFDSLCPKRSDGSEGGSGTRIVNQLLTEMDGIEDRKGVYLLAATNRPDIIDPAILRPGRLDTILYVGLPDEADRVEILKALTKNRTKPVLDDDVDIMKLGKLTDGYTGADLAGLLRQASLLALRDSIQQNTSKSDSLSVNEKHFENALNLTKPSVSAEDRKVYERLRIKYAAPRQQQNTQSDAEKSIK